MIIAHHVHKKLFANSTFYHVLNKTLTTQSMSHAWSVKKVAPDLKFEIPAYKLAVQYPDITINEGTTIKPAQAKDPPNVSWTPKDKSSVFAVSLIDLDAPSRSKPSYREWIHWLVANIEGNDVKKGETLADYIGPGPPRSTDLHRYIILLFSYPKKVHFQEQRLPNTTYEGRRNFSIRLFAEKYKLGDPIAGNFFMAEFDDSVPALHRKIGLIKD